MRIINLLIFMLCFSPATFADDENCGFEHFCETLNLHRYTTDSFPNQSLTELILRVEHQLDWDRVGSYPDTTEQIAECRAVLNAIRRKQVEEIKPEWVVFDHRDPRMDEFKHCLSKSGTDSSQKISSEQEPQWLGFAEFSMGRILERPPRAATFRKFQAELNGESLIWLEYLRQPVNGHLETNRANLINLRLSECLEDTSRSIEVPFVGVIWHKIYSAPRIVMTKNGLLIYSGAIYSYFYSYSPQAGGGVLRISKQENIFDREQWFSYKNRKQRLGVESKVCSIRQLDSIN